MVEGSVESGPMSSSQGAASLSPGESAAGLNEEDIVERVQLPPPGASSPGIDFELCKTSVHERLKTFERWPMAAQVRSHKKIH